MKKLFFLLLTVYNLNQSYAQTIKVYDLDTNEPVPFVILSYFKNEVNIGSDYCNKNGFVIIKNNEFNKIEISCIGYESKIITDITIVDKVFLKKKVIALEEVVILNNNDKKILLGYTDKRKKISISGSKGFEICEFINNPYKSEKTIKSFLFKIKRKKSFRTAIRLHFYNKKDDKIAPGNEILKEDIIYYFDGKIKDLIEVDVSSYNIQLPSEGAFVGIEWLGIVDQNGSFIENIDEWNDTSIELNDEIIFPYTFIKSRTGQNNWYNTEKLKKDISKFTNYPNATFGIKIFE